MRIAALFAVVLLAGVASAQTPFDQNRAPPNGGAAQLPSSAALVQDATAVQQNPAGLSFVDGPDFAYIHDRDARLGNDGVIDAFYLGGSFGSDFNVGLGIDLQFIRPRFFPAYRETTLALSLGTPTLSAGFDVDLFGSDVLSDLGEATNHLKTMDVGLTWRPYRYVSLAGVIRQLDAPSLGTTPLPRSYELSLGFRPFTERVSLSATFLIDEQSGLRGSWLRYAAQVEVFHGLTLLLGLGHNTELNGGFFAQAGLSVSLGQVSVGYAGAGNGTDWGRLDDLVAVHVSRDRSPVIGSLSARYVIIDPASELTPPSRGLLSTILPSAPRDPYLSLLALLERVRDDPEVDGVVLRVAELDELGFARVDELRTALFDIRQHGKKVVAYFVGGGDAEYFLATAADRIYVPPQATLLINGLAAETRFYNEALTKLGVAVDVVRVGPYKTAPDAFTRSEISPEQKQTIEGLLDVTMARYEAEVERTRHLSADKFHQAINRGIIVPEEAKQAGLVDDVIYPDEMDERLKDLAGGPVGVVDGYADRIPAERRWGKRPTIAVVRVVGTIASGKNRVDPLGLVTISGASSVLHAIQDAEDDDDVAAIVVRVDSGGGSGDASDLIYRALVKAKEKKPVIASMGDVCASGGYYIAMAADEMFAEPETVTGSIGVFALKPDVSGLFGKLGVHTDVIQRGEKADLFSFSRPWTPPERVAMQHYIDVFYEGFASKVAASRKMKRDDVEPIGRGRVYAGADAREKHLVDSLGGFSSAVAAAKRRARISANAEVDVTLFDQTPSSLDLGLGLTHDDAPTSSLVRRVVPASVAAMAEIADGPLTMLPFEIRIR
jgi:protease IV